MSQAVFSSLIGIRLNKPDSSSITLDLGLVISDKFLSNRHLMSFMPSVREISLTLNDLNSFCTSSEPRSL
jgi:hypothetical protein